MPAAVYVPRCALRDRAIHVLDEGSPRADAAAGGIRGSSGMFELPDDEVWRLLGFQKSAFGDRAHVKFTVNLSTIDREVWQLRRTATPGTPARPSANTYYGYWARQQRIGQVVPGGNDLWWDVYPDTHIQELDDRVSRVRTLARPSGRCGVQRGEVSDVLPLQASDDKRAGRSEAHAVLTQDGCRDWQGQRPPLMRSARCRLIQEALRALHVMAHSTG